MTLPTLTPRSQGRPRPEVPRIDELAEGVPARSGEPDPATAAALAAIVRAPNGTVTESDSAAALGRIGGLRKAKKDRLAAETPRLAKGLGIREVSVPELVAYLDDATELAAHECARLGRVVGGGDCGTAPSVIVASAALQIAGSRYSFARGDIVTGSRLADAARANFLSAHELAAREASLRPRRDDGPPPGFTWDDDDKPKERTPHGQ